MPTPDIRRYRLSTQDATFIYGESENGPLHIGSILVFDGKLEFDQFAKHVEDRLHLVPRYRQRLVPVPFNVSHAMMEDDPKFRVENHLFRHILRPGIDRAAAIEEILRHYEVPLDRSRPLWEMHSFENFEGARTAIVSKVHHALVDGVSGVELLKVMFDLKANPDPIEPPAVPWTSEKPSSGMRRLIEAMSERSQAPLRTTLDVARDIVRNPDAAADRARTIAAGLRHAGELATRRLASTPWNSGIVGQRRTLASTAISFGEFRAIRNAFGGSINDVVLTILTEGAARYLRHHGYKATGKLCVGCPVNVRHKDEASTLGNRVSMMFPMLPAEPMDVVERLRLVSAETEQIKASQLPQALEAVMSLSDNIPPGLIGAGSRVGTAALDAVSALFRLSGYKPRPDRFLLPAVGINFIATNVPGVQVPQYLFGHKCLEQIPLVPLGAVLGFGVAILSYNQTLTFGMVADPNLMPDVALMKFYVDESFGELKARCQEKAETEESTHAAAAGG